MENNIPESLYQGAGRLAGKARVFKKH